MPLACRLGQNLPLSHELRRGALKRRAVCLRLALPCYASVERGVELEQREVLFRLNLTNLRLELNLRLCLVTQVSSEELSYSSVRFSLG